MTSTRTSVQIERALRQRLLRAYRGLFPEPPKRIVLGFSGGGDSLALALLFRNISNAIPSKLLLAHVDHRIRAESGADAKRARELAATLGIPFKLLRTEAHPVELHSGVGLEEAARRERYRLLASIRETGDIFAFAHHAGDQVETVLLHVLRGAGLEGVAGMGDIDVLEIPWWESGPPEHELPIWRPVLRESQQDLRAILAGTQLTPIEDPSNNDVELRRNEIRHLLIPAIKAIEPAYEERFAELSQIADEENDLLYRYANDARWAITRDDGSLLSHELVLLPVALARRVTRAWLTDAIGQVPSFDRVRAVLAFAAKEDFSGEIEVGEDFVVGNFSFALRCGRREELEEQAWEESVLALPRASHPQWVTIEGDTVIIRSPTAKRVVVTHSLVDNPNGVISIETVDPREKREGLKSDWNAWLRDRRVSAWIRDDVQGIAVDGVVRWIPRVDDRHEPDGGRVIRVEVQPGE